MATAVWSVLKAKRRKLLYQDGFISHFYGIMEHLSPVLAWGFLGPESDLKKSCFIFKVKNNETLFFLNQFDVVWTWAGLQKKNWRKRMKKTQSVFSD